MNIQESLKILGFTDKEAAVYAALLQMKKGTAMSVATAASIKRPTAYFVLGSLIEKKLVRSTKFRNVKDYRAMPLEHLKSFVYKQKTAAEKSLPDVQALYNKRQFKSRLRVYSGASAVKTLLEKSLREKNTVHILGHEHWFATKLEMYWYYFLKRTQQLNIPPVFKPYGGDAMMMLWSDKVGFVERGNSEQVFGFKNKELCEMYMQAFNTYEATTKAI